MHCQACAGHLRRSLEKVEGVTLARVDLEKGEATVEHEGVSAEALAAAVDEAGYKVT
jgi:mercuric reductase/Cu+-exporting ATPase